MYTFMTLKDFEQISNTEYTHLCLDDIRTYFSDYTEAEIIRIFGKTIYATYTKTLLEESKITTKQPEQVKPITKQVDINLDSISPIVKNRQKLKNDYPNSILYIQHYNKWLKEAIKYNIHEYIYSFIYTYPQYFNYDNNRGTRQQVNAYNWVKLSDALKVASDNNSLSSIQDIQKLLDIHILPVELQEMFLHHITQNYPDIFTSKQKETTTQTTYQICNNSHTKEEVNQIKNKSLAINSPYIDKIQKIRNDVLRRVIVEYQGLSFNSIRDIQKIYINTIKEIFKSWSLSKQDAWIMMNFADAAYYLYKHTKYNEFLLIHYICKDRQNYLQNPIVYKYLTNDIKNNKNKIIYNLLSSPIDDYFVEEFKKFYIECKKY